CTGRHGGDDYW
nr:immunoglobulin heavy chain junction region [Macaca mulatta]MOW33578.1 immunoglobulin heavy chain junction region [Macaca mulatta]